MCSRNIYGWWSDRLSESGYNKSFNERDFIAKLIFKPKDFSLTVTISLTRSQIVHGGFFNILRLFVNNILPSDSLFFKLAADGWVKDLVRLVADRKTFLRNHD